MPSFPSGPAAGRAWPPGLLIALFSLPLVGPLLHGSAAPCTHDGHLHTHRVAALRHSLESGLLFSRWMPDLVFGYGYPFLNYREAFPLYLVLVPHWLGLPLPAAFNLVYLLSLLAAGWFMFLWVRDLLGPLAGVVSAVAYLAAPYLLIDATVRGNLPESVALGLFPLLAWTGRRFVLSGAARPFLAAVLALALLALTHNISLLLFIPFLVGYLLVAGRLESLAWRPLLGRAALLLALGLALAAFYTVPAVLELDEITIRQSVTSRNNDFRFNFATVGEILAPVRPSDPDLLNPALPIRLGWLPAGLALLGLVASRWAPTRRQRGHLLFMAAAALGLLFMALGASRAVWESLPFIEFVQFPWRFVGRAALPVAFLAGAPFGLLAARSAASGRRPLAAPLLAALAAGLLVLEALPYAYPAMCPEAPQLDISAVHAYERQTGLVGVDPEGSYFPRTVTGRPTGSPLEADYRAGRPPQRFDAAALPAGAEIVSAVYRPTSARLEVNGPAAFQARYLSLAFPGWTARVDGQPAAITPSDPEGLITFAVPAGRHEIEVRWGLTPLRAAAGFASLLALAGTAAVALRLRGRERLEVKGAAGAAGPGQLAVPGVVMLAAAAVALIGFKLAVVDQTATPLRRAAPPPVSAAADVRAGGLRLAGFNVSRPVVASGEPFDVDLAWQVLETPAADLQSNVWLQGPDGLLWSDKETQRPRLYEDAPPTTMWPAGRWAWDSRVVQVLPGTPPGRYDLVLTLFDKSDLAPLRLAAANGAAAGPAAVIGTVEVVSPPRPGAIHPQYPADEAIGGLRFLGYSQDRQEARPGEAVLVTLFWERANGKPADGAVALHLLDADGAVAREWTLPPVRADYPPAAWRPGERLRGQHALRLPAGLADGSYAFTLEGRPLGTLAVAGPQRNYEAPAYETAVGARFGDAIELVGYSSSRADLAPAAPLTVTLVWRGRAEMAVSYRVFVHLVDERGEIVAQSDAEPADWVRPTTGWALGEYVVDSHQLNVPAGLDPAGLRLRVGLYDATSGARLPTAAGEAFVLLPLTTDE